MSSKLGEILVRENLITPQQLREALDYQRVNGGRLGSNLIKLGIISDDVITAVLSRQYGVPSINLDLFHIEPPIIKLISQEVALKYTILPISRAGTTLTLAMADPTNVFAIDDIKFMTELNIEPVIASESSIQMAIGKYYSGSTSIDIFDAAFSFETEKTNGRNGSGKNGMRAKAGSKGKTDERLVDSDLAVSLDDFDLSPHEGEEFELLEDNEEIDLATLAKASEDAPVIRLVNVLMVDSLRRGASDIHVEPYEKDFRIRFRIDGVLYDVMHPPMKLRDPLISRLKIMAKLDISEKRLPQDGRIKIKVKVDDRSRELDFRVSTLPTLFGEKVVLRLLDKDKLMLDMTKLGFEPESLDKFQRAIANPYGMVLVTGPTGSGKTNTLYSALQSLNQPETNIMTAEDPVEFNLPGINQVQIRDNIGLNFAAVLRSFLRQDPNIILVGEIRDYETAEIAVKAALTGHLVLSTLHTNDAPSTISRMVNMGIEPFLVGTAVNLIQAQRLVRRVCAKCKFDDTANVPTKSLVDIGFQPDVIGSFQVMKGKGCATCNGTGYKGRVGLYEVMEITEGIRDLIMVGATAVEIKRKALEEGMLTLRMSGLEKIKSGVTTVEEVLRETVL